MQPDYSHPLKKKKNLKSTTKRPAYFWQMTSHSFCHLEVCFSNDGHFSYGGNLSWRIAFYLLLMCDKMLPISYINYTSHMYLRVNTDTYNIYTTRLLCSLSRKRHAKLPELSLKHPSEKFSRTTKVGIPFYIYAPSCDPSQTRCVQQPKHNKQRDQSLGILPCSF